MYCLCCESKEADQLCSYCTADLCLCFRQSIFSVFLCMGSSIITKNPTCNFRFIVRIDHWESGSQYPNGHFVRSLGQIGDLETEIKAILVENDISVPPFSEAQVTSKALAHCGLVEIDGLLVPPGKVSNLLTDHLLTR